MIEGEDEMRLLKQNLGFTVLEAVASVVIVTLVFTTAITIITAMRNQTIATENKRLAVEVASRMRNDVVNTLTYSEVSAFLLGDERVITFMTSHREGSIITSDFFVIDDQLPFNVSDISITFFAATDETIKHRIVRFEISITYYKNRNINIEGIIYAT